MEDLAQKFDFIQELLSLSVISESDSRSHHYELGRFKNAINSYLKGGRFDIPGYTWREINPWRFFILNVPESFCLIEQVLRNHNTWSSPSQICAALVLASSMTHSPDKLLADRSHAILQYLLNEIGEPTTCDNYQSYLFFHQYYFSLVQASPKYGHTCETFVFKNGVGENKWELLLNREYYECNDDSVTQKVLRKKLFETEKVFPRDINLQSIRQYQYKIIEKHGFFTEKQIIVCETTNIFNHYGFGDNIAGDKIETNNYLNEKNRM